MKSLVIVFLMIPAVSTATKFKADLKSEGQVTFKSEENGKAVRAFVKSGFHFNAESPAYAKSQDQKLDAKSRSEKEILFALPESKSGAFELRFYVCDDAKTVCEMHRQAWGKETGKSGAKELFGKDDLQAALGAAKKDNKLVFIDFAGSWCPPCIRLEHEVFPTKEFKKAAEKYVMVRLDVDLPANEKWMEKYNVKAFPTLVVTNSEGEELGRKLDFQTAQHMSLFLNAIAKEIPPTQGELRKQAEAGEKSSQEKLAAEYLKALNYVEALAWYDKADNKSARRAEARIGFWDGEWNDAKKDPEKAKAKENLKLAYKESATKFPEEILAIDWQKNYADLLDEEGLKDEAKKEYEKAKTLAMKWIENPSFLRKNTPPELGDLTLPELWSKVSEIEEKLGAPDKVEKVKQAQEKAIAETLKLKPTVKTPTHVIYLVAYMKPVRDLTEIEPWLLKLEEAYPQEFTYYQRHAKLLLDKGESLRALPIAEKAYGMAFGSNQLTIGLLLAKIHKDLQNKDQMKALLKELKSQPHFSSKRNRHASKAISDFEVSLKK